MYTLTGTHMHMYVLMNAGREINKIPFAFHLIEPFQKAKHCKCRVRFWCVYTCHTVLHSRRVRVDKLLQQAYTHLLLLSSILSCGLTGELVAVRSHSEAVTDGQDMLLVKELTLNY